MGEALARRLAPAVATRLLERSRAGAAAIASARACLPAGLAQELPEAGVEPRRPIRAELEVPFLVQAVWPIPANTVPTVHPTALAEAMNHPRPSI